METMIEFRHVKKSYGDKPVLKDFNLTVEKGEFVTIIGSSGCGKTTALKMVNGLLEPDEGDFFGSGSPDDFFYHYRKGVRAAGNGW